MKKLLNDILKAKEGVGIKYSQGRVYLFVVFVVYVLYILFLSVQFIRCENSINIDNANTIISALQWAMGLLTGYVFGAKGIEALKIVVNGKPKDQENSQHPKEEDMS